MRNALWVCCVPLILIHYDIAMNIDLTEHIWARWSEKSGTKVIELYGIHEWVMHMKVWHIAYSQWLRCGWTICSKHWYGHSIACARAKGIPFLKSTLKKKVGMVKIFHLFSNKITDNWTRDTWIFVFDCKMKNYQLAICVSFFLKFVVQLSRCRLYEFHLGKHSTWATRVNWREMNSLDTFGQKKKTS